MFHRGAVPKLLATASSSYDFAILRGVVVMDETSAASLEDNLLE